MIEEEPGGPGLDGTASRERRQAACEAEAGSSAREGHGHDAPCVGGRRAAGSRGHGPGAHGNLGRLPGAQAPESAGIAQEREDAGADRLRRHDLHRRAELPRGRRCRLVRGRSTLNAIPRLIRARFSRVSRRYRPSATSRTARSSARKAGRSSAARRATKPVLYRKRWSGRPLRTASLCARENARRAAR